jgi:hypothetical protein
MQRAACQKAQIDGTKANLVRFGGAVGAVDGIVARIKKKAKIN